MEATEAPRGSFADREAGRADNGTVDIRDFDRGVVESLGAKVVGEDYLVQIPGVQPPPGRAGVPVVFAYPEDPVDDYILPGIEVMRGDFSPAMNRWQPGNQQFRAPARTAHPVQVIRGESVLSGHDRMVQRPQAVPFDIQYTISARAFRRGGKGKPQQPPRGSANMLMTYVMSRFQPYTGVRVVDSVGDTRIYFATVDSYSPLDEATTVGERVIGWSFTLTVEGELDLNEEVETLTVYRQTTRIEGAVR